MEAHAYLIIVGFYGFDVQFFLYLLYKLFLQQLHVHRGFSKQFKRAFISKYSITYWNFLCLQCKIWGMCNFPVFSWFFQGLQEENISTYTSCEKWIKVAVLILKLQSKISEYFLQFELKREQVSLWLWDKRLLSDAHSCSNACIFSCINQHQQLLLKGKISM